MTIYEHSIEQATGEDRRQVSLRDRLSWASDSPFIAVDASGNPVDPAARADQRRARWARPLVSLLVLGDLVSGVVVLLGICLVEPVMSDAARFLPLLGALAWPIMLMVNRAYDSRLIGEGADEFQALLLPLGLTLAIHAVAAVALHDVVPPRYLLMGPPLIAFGSGVWHYLVRSELHRRRSSGRHTLRTLLVGNPSAVDRVAADLRSAPHHGYAVLGACVPGELFDVDVDSRLHTLGTLSDVPQVVIDHEIDAVIVVGHDLQGRSLRRLSWALEKTGAELIVAPGLVEVTGPRLHMRPTAGLSLVHVEAPSGRAGRMLGKAALDRVLGAVLFLLTLPLVALAGALVAATSRGGAFYRQVRIGKDGKPFTLWKVRTMVRDADRLRQQVLPCSERDGLMFKMRADPRVTSVGAVLRRLSVDELPQLWNVVCGSMSLVGPRPPLPEEYALYHDKVHRRLRVKPGMTGLWQVSGRSDLNWDESIRLDLRYVDNWSVALDMQVLWKTLRAVVRGDGAY
jgi:exopolysaccharide biosynthesis polyprenyl glycosylphosphotransferase